MIHTGDCLVILPTLPAESVDAIVTDPPYDLLSASRNGSRRINNPDNPAGRTGRGFMGKTWDGTGIAFRPETWAECLRVAKPGAYLLAFGGTRTVHRMASAIEDAGWIIRDQLMWIYASGFPKGKANLKPAHEPIVLARKPGPLRPLAIDECRIPADYAAEQAKPDDQWQGPGEKAEGSTVADRISAQGRWPSNLLLSDPELFDQPNPYVVGSGATANSGWTNDDLAVDRDPTSFSVRKELAPGPHYGDSGGYSRFFIIPKADRADREPVLRGTLTETKRAILGQGIGGADNLGVERENAHPTVKPTDLMRHLVRLVTPSGGTVLDPFLGSGSTAIACELEGFPWIGIEKEPEYVAIAEARLNGTQRGLGLDTPLVGEPRKSVDGVAVRHKSGGNTFGGEKPKPPMPDMSYRRPRPDTPARSDSIAPGMFDEEPAA
jgi:DNA modification methylase